MVCQIRKNRALQPTVSENFDQIIMELMYLFEFDFISNIYWNVAFYVDQIVLHDFELLLRFKKLIHLNKINYVLYIDDGKKFSSLIGDNAFYVLDNKISLLLYHVSLRLDDFP